MHMRPVEFAIAIDVCPSFKIPFSWLRLLATLFLKALRCLVRDRKYLLNQALASAAAELKPPGFRMPTAVVRLGHSRISGCVRHDPHSQQGIEVGFIL